MLFCSCRACAKIFNEDTENTLTSIRYTDEDGVQKKFYTAEDVCQHTDEEREYVAVVGHDELKHALEKKYIITKLYNAMVWEENNIDGKSNYSQYMFRDYIRDFIKIKTEASGWPESCTDPENAPEKNEMLKKKFIDHYKANFDIDLERDVLDEGLNEGMRYIAKQFLNSLWGRFGLRSNLYDHKVTSNRDDFCDVWYNPKLECRHPIKLDEQGSKILLVGGKSKKFL